MQLATALRFGNIDALDRELLLQAILKKDRVFLLAHPEYELSEKAVKHFEELVKRRELQEPLAYILGEKEFFGLSFLVNRYTLIPRPETEILVGSALAFLHEKKNKKKITTVDVGTGSGCIIISLIKNLKDVSGTDAFYAVDSSSEAIDTARKNAQAHGVADQITFTQSDLLNNMGKELASCDHLLILANLPYLSEALYQSTDVTVQAFEPESALVSGRDGLDHYRRLLGELAYLAKTKKIDFILEISPEQAALVPKLCWEHCAKLERILPDLSGQERIVIGTY